MRRPLTGVEAALLEFQRAPLANAGILRRPALLFASVREVLLCAAGRAHDEADATEFRVQEAASEFIRAALLFPGADHYQLLGLQPGADATDVKDRYRLLMRLTHPDFAATSPGAWPPDAAVRLNLAYEELSSSKRRAAYDRTLPAQAAASVAAQPTRLAASNRMPLAVRRDPARGAFLRLAAGFGLFGAAVAMLLVLIGAFQEREMLVQREASPGSRPAVDRSPALFSAQRVAVATPASVLMPPPGLASEPVNGHARVPVPATATAEPPPVPAAAAAPVLPVLAVPPVEAPVVQLPPVAPAVVVAAAAGPSPGALAPAAVPSPEPAATAVPRAAPAKILVPGPTLAQAQPILLALFQQLESADVDRVLSRLDRDARASASAQGFMRQFQTLVEGARSVRLAGVSLHAEPLEGRLVVTGSVQLQVSHTGGAPMARELPMVAEFATRDGAVTMTGLGLGKGGR